MSSALIFPSDLVFDGPEEFRKLFERANVLLVIAGFEGRFKRLNPAWERILGHPVDELLGTPCLDLVHPEDRAATQAEIERLAAANETVDFENRCRHRDGSYRWLSWHATSDLEERRVYGVAFDVSGRRQAEAALRDSEELRRAMTESASDYLAVVDPDARIIFANRTVPGQTVETVLGTTPYDWLSESYRQPMARCLERVFADGQTEYFEAPYPDDSGTWFESRIEPVFRDGEVVAATVSSRDLSQRKQAEKAQQLGETRLRAFLESLDDIAFELDGDGVYLNAWTRDPGRLLLPRDELIGKNLIETHGPEHGRLFLDLVQRVIATGQLQSVDYTLQLPDGERAFSAIVSPIAGGPDTPTRVACLVRDVTERKRAEEDREALIRQLAAKNEELERYTYTVSHDLKSPLVTITGFVGLIEQSARSGDLSRLESDVARIKGAAGSMKQLLDELLELSRIGRMDNAPENVAMSELAGQVVELFDGIGEPAIRFRVAPDLPVVRGDRIRIRQLLQNLVDNAIKFMGDEPEPCVEIGSRTCDGETVFTVRDNGIGIDPQFHDKVFGLFDQLQKQSPGTGIGLALVARIVDLHGGRAWVESQGEGHGSCFCFTLPGKAS